MIYLIHFSHPVGHARHYLGYCRQGELAARLEEHRTGRGARLTQVAVERGADLWVVRVWEGGRNDERRMKSSTHVWRCPLCADLKFMKEAFRQHLPTVDLTGSRRRTRHAARETAHS